MHYLIENEIRMQFSNPVAEHQCELRIAPYLGNGQETVEVSLQTQPASEVRGFVDCFGNQVHHFGIVHPHEALSVHCRSAARTARTATGTAVSIAPERERQWLGEMLRAKPRLWGYVLHRSAATPNLRTLNLGDLDPPRHDPASPLQSSVLAAIDWMQDNFSCEVERDAADLALGRFIERMSGTDRDFAHLFIAIVRAWGIPARYATGYMDPGSLDSDAPATFRSWAEVLLPDLGWVGFDPGRGLPVDDAYVLTAVGRDCNDAAPFRGSFKGENVDNEQKIEIRMSAGA